ncbi:MAG: hypothetical protein H8E87_03795 [FCB group bacterium]|nr:hypothetical protein [FCB group bacterium]
MPALTGYYTTSVSLGVAVSGNYAYVANRGSLLILDCSEAISN